VEDNRYIGLKEILEKHAVTTLAAGNMLKFSRPNKNIAFYIVSEGTAFEKYKDKKILHLDQLIREPEKIAAIILSKLHVNKTVFARNCEVKKAEKKEAEEFLEKYHLMNSTRSAFNLGLYYKNELIALATFSKGRKMNRLKADQRSFELIRFCCKAGITITGGLTKLVKNFCEEKKAGDVMTYVDKQISDGAAFIRAGFKISGETEPNYFLVNRTTFERIPANKEEVFDQKKFHLSRNLGNIKLIYTPGE